MPNLVQPLAMELEEKTIAICKWLLDKTLDESVWKRAILPTSLGALGIRSPLTQTDTAYKIIAGLRNQQVTPSGRMLESSTAMMRDIEMHRS